MAAVISGRSDHDRAVKVKYTPIKDNYRGHPLDVSVIGDGKRSSASLRPGVWTKISVACARELLSKVEKAKRRARFKEPDGNKLDAQMRQGASPYSEGGVNYDVRDQYFEPPYEIQIEGSLD